jgi:hypothetical protein
MAWISWNICKKLNFDIKRNKQALISPSFIYAAHVLHTDFVRRLSKKNFTW